MEGAGGSVEAESAAGVLGGSQDGAEDQDIAESVEVDIVFEVDWHLYCPFDAFDVPLYCNRSPGYL